jgi:hypothetical protein
MSESMSAEEYNALIASRGKDRKYHNVPVEVDGKPFDSTAEGTRYWELCRLQEAGEITDLETQPVFPLVVNGVKVAQYRADFRFKDRDGRIHVEDVKGVRTPVYKLKARMVKAIYGIDITEVEA